MNNDLMLYANGDMEPSRKNREVAKKAKDIYEKVQLADLKVRGAVALAADIMDGAAALHQKAKQLAGDDVALGMTLGAIEMNTVRQTMGVQNTLFNEWDI